MNKLIVQEIVAIILPQNFKGAEESLQEVFYNVNNPPNLQGQETELIDRLTIR